MNKILRNLLPAVGLIATSASASVIGTLDTSSTGQVTVTINSVTFSSDPSAIGGGDADVSSASSLIFTGCATGVNGSSGCLTTGEGINVASPITGATIGDPTFLTFASTANLVYSLTGITTYSNASCTTLTVGTSCVVYPGSPLLLTLLPNNQTLVSLSVSGMASDTGILGLASGSPYAGGFSETLTTLLPDGSLPTPADIQHYFCGTNTVTSIGQCSTTASLTDSESGSFTASSAAPEPSTTVMVLLGAGLIGLATQRRRRVQ